MNEMFKLNMRPSERRGYVSAVIHNVPSLALIHSGNLCTTIVSENMNNILQIKVKELRPLSMTDQNAAKEKVMLKVLGKMEKEVKLMLVICGRL